jgi:hypothetical protein
MESVGWKKELAAIKETILDMTNKKVSLPVANDEINYFLEIIKTGSKAIYSPELGYSTSSHLHLGNIALKLNHKVEWDPLNESFVNDTEVEKFRKKEIRDKWSYRKICPKYKY